MKKQISFKNKSGLVLVGTLWQAPSDMVVLMAHGSASNRFARGLYAAIAQALQQENYNVLSFDFSGHGESQDDIITVQKAGDDVRSAIEFCKKSGFKKIVFIGHSLGALAGLIAYTPDISTMILIGGLTGPVVWKWEDMCSPEQIEQMHKTGYVVAEVNDGLRKEVKVDAALLKDILAIDQEKLFTQISSPILLVHGDADQQELDLLAISKKGLHVLPPGSQLKIIKGAGHSFKNATQEVIDLIQQWLVDY